MRVCSGRHLRGGASCEAPQLEEERGETTLRWVRNAAEKISRGVFVQMLTLKSSDSTPLQSCRTGCTLEYWGKIMCTLY